MVRHLVYLNFDVSSEKEAEEWASKLADSIDEVYGDIATLIDCALLELGPSIAWIEAEIDIECTEGGLSGSTLPIEGIGYLIQRIRATEPVVLASLLLEIQKEIDGISAYVPCAFLECGTISGTAFGRGLRGIESTRLEDDT